MKQMTIDGWLTEEKEPLDKLEIGRTMHRVVLDIVESGKIVDSWQVEGRGIHGYRVADDKGYRFTFWDDDMGKTVFEDKAMALHIAESRKDKLTIIRSENMVIVDELNLYEKVDDNRGQLNATAKLLKGNMTYLENWMCYPFLKVFETEEEARKNHKENIKKIQGNHIPKTWKVTDVSLKLKDMYLTQVGKWSEYRYATVNGVVWKGKKE